MLRLGRFRSLTFLFTFCLLILTSIILSPSTKANCAPPVCILGSCQCFPTLHFHVCWSDVDPSVKALCCDTADECGTSILPEKPWCVTGDASSGVNTALGCIQTSSTSAFATQILTWGVGLSAGAALLAVAFAGFTILTAGGDPKKVKAGQELIVAAVTGVLLIALSVVILNFIGINVLNLGGLGF